MSLNKKYKATFNKTIVGDSKLSVKQKLVKLGYNLSDFTIELEEKQESTRKFFRLRKRTDK